MSYIIPKGWTKIKFVNLISPKKNSLRRGPFGSAIKKVFFVPKGMKVYEQKNAIYNDCNLGNYYIDDEKYEELKGFSVGPEDFIVSCAGTIGKISQLPSNAPKGVINQALMKVAINPNVILPNYFLKFFKSPVFQEKVLKDTRGSAMRNMSSVSDIKSIDVLLPPLPEQKRIADKLDCLLAKVDACKARLDKVPEIIKRFRQSVLADATSGRLSEDWRDQNSRLTRNEYLTLRSNFELSTEYKVQNKIPKSWKWQALGNIADLARGRFSIRPRNDPRYYSGLYPFIQIGDLPREGGYVDKHKQTLNDKGLKASKIFKKDTIAIAIVGATIANTGILAYDMCFPDSLVGINTKERISNLYIEYYFRSEKENIRNFSYSSGGQPNIKLPTLNSYPIPVPPFEELTEIVNRIEALFSVADQMEEKLKRAKLAVDKLTASILAKAFRGELIPQDPNDEPAAALLERINPTDKN